MFIYNPQLKKGEAAKFHRNWKGPFTIADKITDVNYILKGPKRKVVHSDNMKLYKSKDDIEREKSSQRQTVEEESTEEEEEREKDTQEQSSLEESNSAEDSNESSSTEDSNESSSTKDHSDADDSDTREENGDRESSDDDDHDGSKTQRRKRQEPIRYGDWVFQAVETYFMRDD